MQKQIIRQHLAEDYTEPFRDPLWNHVYLSPPLKRIVSTKQFQKLAGIKQLGPAHMVYPGATHTRFGHSIGVFEIAKRIVAALLNLKVSEHLTLKGVKAFLAAALLHDLGHFPYAHSLKELPLKSHEALTGEIILSTDIRRILQEEVGADPVKTASIIDLHHEGPFDFEVALFRKVLSGVLDPDKLDYLTRDAFFCGVSYGTQDIDFILNKLAYHPSSGLVLEEQGITAVEHILFSKYLMYRTVYWHKTVRIATAMIKHAIFSGMKSGQLKPDDLYGLDDENFLRLEFALIKRVAERDLYKCVWESTFDSGNSSHTRLLDLETRLAMEQSITSSLRTGRGSVIIDIPEPISFEVSLFIRNADSLTPFVESGTIFQGDVVRRFVDTLRKIRVFVDPILVIKPETAATVAQCFSQS